MSVVASDTLPDISSEYRIDPEQIATFRRDGHVLLRGVCSAEEIKAWREVIRRVSAEHNAERRAIAERDAFGKAFLQTMNLRLRDRSVARFVLSPRFGKIAADLMGVDGVRIFHDQSLFKEPGGGINPTPWHQDQYYWPFAEMTTLGMWMPLVDIAPDMGAMIYASGTHRRGFLGQHAISDESQRIYSAMIDAERIPIVTCAPIKAGDACFHYGWTLHAAGANCSQTLREAMIVTFFADGMRVMTPTNPSQESDRVRFLGNRPPGAVADSDLNTLVWSARQSCPRSGATAQRGGDSGADRLD
jgi:ectoine hydroxylase-related dioxygenase (phytanoyl-CoA dioxygenase family)